MILFGFWPDLRRTLAIPSAHSGHTRSEIMGKVFIYYPSRVAEKGGYKMDSVRQSVRLSVHLSVCLSVYLSVSLSVCMSVCHNLKKKIPNIFSEIVLKTCQ